MEIKTDCQYLNILHWEIHIYIRIHTDYLAQNYNRVNGLKSVNSRQKGKLYLAPWKAGFVNWSDGPLVKRRYCS